MRLSTKGRYGVKALFELALRYGAGPVSLKEIAENQGLSEHYLEQLAGPLRKAGLIASVRGAHGGYVLARPPEQIRVGDILRALEGPLEEPGRPGAGRDVWCRVTARLVQVLDTLTLGDLVDEVRREQESLMYYI
ncbi:MAG: Rrf2 family transcriptional regulator [Bacillota bacterium]|nr:MAG: AsnC family transcriptional regulator [Bacillota bacterium]